MIRHAISVIILLAENQMKKAFFRFYEELNDFLPGIKKKKEFEHNYTGRNSIKDMVESLGVPHTEVDMILVNGKSIGFDYIVQDKDQISVYPVFESLDISGVQHLRAKPLRIPRFVVDNNLGSLAKYMRMLGLDTHYSNSYKDDEIIKISLNEKRVILTKNKNLLKRKDIAHGYWVRDIIPEEQAAEIIKRFDLRNDIKEFCRCIRCNTELMNIEKNKIEKELPPKVRDQLNEFSYCKTCGRIYWKGTHYENMLKKIKSILQ